MSTASEDRSGRQQRLLSGFGAFALQRQPVPKLIDAAARVAADGVGAELSKVLELLPEGDRLIVRAGIGWQPGTIDHATVGADLASPAGYALRTGTAVISNQLGTEDRFRTPDLLDRHGVRRAMNVILQGDGRPYGVLEVDSRSPGAFDESDTAFLEGIAHLLGMALQRERHDRGLKDALQRQRVLLDEVNHRIKNNLQLVRAMLDLQASTTGESAAKRQLEQASLRVAAIAAAHERLGRQRAEQDVDLGRYLAEICGEVGGCTLHIDGPPALSVPVDKAIPIALVLNELITNAAKHAYPGQARQPIWVSLAPRPRRRLVISVRDEGIGVPAAPTAPSGGLGMRIVTALVSQLGAELAVSDAQPGTEFVITIPDVGPP